MHPRFFANSTALSVFALRILEVMADDSGRDGKHLRPVRKSKQIAEDMRLAMIMANELSKQIDKEEKVRDV